MRGRLSVILPGAVLALLVIVAFWPVASGRRSFFHLDLRYEHLPVWSVTAASAHGGRVAVLDRR